MSTYHYENGANHHDNHKEITINLKSVDDPKAILRELLKEDAEEADFEEAAEGLTDVQDTASPSNADDIMRLMERIEAKLDLLSTGMRFKNNERKQWHLENVKEMFRGVLNVEGNQLNKKLEAQSRVLTQMFFRRNRTKEDRCFDLTMMNVLGFAGSKNVLPYNETEIVTALYPCANKAEIDAHKSALKKGYALEGSIVKVKDLLETVVERIR